MVFLSKISVWIIPALLLLIPLWAYIKKVPVYDVFAEGAMEGVKTAVRIFPYIVTMLIAIAIFRDGGGLVYFSKLLSPVTELLGVPVQVAPLALVRPLSGSASLGMTAELLQTYGPDSFIGRMASVMQGSTDTTFYILTVYFGSQGIKKFRHAALVGIIADCAAFLAAVILCHFFFA